MPPPMMRTSTLLTRLPSRSSLVDTLAPPTIAATGRFGLPSASLQRLELLLHRPPGMRGQFMGEPLRRRMRAMGGGKGVVDIDVAELGELATWAGSFFSSPLWKRVFSEQEHVAVLHFGDRVVGCLADAVGAEGDRTLDDVGDRGGDGLERIGLVRAALGPAEMRKQNDLAAFVRDFRDGRRDALDARRVGHAAVLRRNVEIDAQEHALAGDVGVVERAERFVMQRLSSFRRQRCVPVPCRSVMPAEAASSPAAPVRAGTFATRLASHPRLSRA